MTIHLNRGHILALFIIATLAVWLTFGAITDDTSYENPRPLIMDNGLSSVQVERMQGELVERNVMISGKTAANRSVILVAETRTKVQEIKKQKGEFVKQGEIIVELEKRFWPNNVEQGKAALKQKELEFKGAQKLLKQGLMNDAEVAQIRTDLAEARANLIKAKLGLGAMSVKAPFDGVVEERYAEIGKSVGTESQLIKLVDFSPYLVKGQVPEKDAALIKIGDSARAHLVTGDIVEGSIRFIASEADPSTRTFGIEIEIEAPEDGSMSSGLTARIEIPQGEQFAHKLSPALLILNEQGQLGVKGINADHQVIFNPIEILRAEGNGIWVTGLEENALVITIGQGFVDLGETVQPVFPEVKDGSQDLAIDKRGN